MREETERKREGCGVKEFNCRERKEETERKNEGNGGKELREK